MSLINESTIKTPGVYVNEIPSFPPSIAQVATAVPAFIGYTQIATKNGKSVVNQAVRISSLVQYVQYFGADYQDLIADVTLKNDNSVDSVVISPKYQLFNAIQMFYGNGGINCYIISVGTYSSSTPVLADFIKTGETRCLDVLRKEDEPTLIVIPDAVLLTAGEFNLLTQASLSLCADLQDRFAILDVFNGDQERSFDNNDVITNFRTGLGSSNLNYGAAYYPWLRSSLSYSFSYRNIALHKNGGPAVFKDIIQNNTFITQLDKADADVKTLISPFINHPAFTDFNTGVYAGTSIADGYNAIPVNNDKVELGLRISYIKDVLLGFIGLNSTITDVSPGTGRTTKDIIAGYVAPGALATLSPMDQFINELLLIDANFPGGAVAKAAVADFPNTYVNAAAVVDATVYGGAADDTAAVKFIKTRVNNLASNALNAILAFAGEVNLRVANLEIQLNDSNAVYNNITVAIKNQGIVVPPSGALAGIYASVDGSRGVWKAPANVSVSGVVEPLVNIDDNTQQDLNVDTDAGKSINAVRAFTGKGILVWGARTLDGNSNDFRYISVRRFYIMVEESVKKAAMQFVFEPNDGNTWVRIRAMIENYLTNLWRLGALAGPKPEQAFYVKVGLGQTMTFDDILNGKMIIEIGMAPVRPAEFIILRFSQIQQQA